jgi:hypothetical protein
MFCIIKITELTFEINTTEMRLLFLLIFFGVTSMVSAQYYFNDILTTKQTNKQYKLLKDNSIQQVTAKSFEADGTISEGFSLTATII